MKFCYEYPHPAVTTDIVVFTIGDQCLQALLIKRNNEPFKDKWALPGGFVDIDEDLDTGASRELEEETNVTGVYLEQLYTFGQPDRDPRERVITVAYYALIPPEKLTPVAASDAAEVKWFALDNLPPLAFDHRAIVDTAQQRISAKTRYSTIAFQFLPERFTLSELQGVFEILLRENLDKRNFRKWILALNCVEETGEIRRNGQHRPAKLYCAKNPDRVDIIK